MTTGEGLQADELEEKPPKQSRRGVITGLAKVAVAAVILFWLYRRGDIRWDSLVRALAHWPVVVAVCGITLVGYYTQGFRWLLLLNARKIDLSSWKAFTYLMEGKFFNLIIPGYFSEDFMRGLYAIRTHKESRSKVIGTLLVDRSSGVFTMFLFGAVGLLLRPSMLDDRRLSVLLWICLAAIGATLVGVVFLRVVERPPEFVLRLAKLLHLHIAIDRMYAEGHYYATNIPLLLLAVLFTLGNQALMIWSFSLIGSTLGMDSVHFIDYVIFAPAGMLATMLPIGPVGLGVGPPAFLSLFKFAGSDQGANLFILYTVIVVVMSLLGGIFYLRNKKPA
jgi:uncharacterized protein (TIRG00374 family)